MQHPRDIISCLADTRSGSSEALTSIHMRIHCATTQSDFNEEQLTEMDRLDIDHFLSTLAEVALAVARRQEGMGDS